MSASATTTGPATFRWQDLPVDRPMDLVERRRVVGQKAMLSHVTLKRGCVVPVHAHENEQFVVMLSGRLRFLVGAEGDPARRDVSVGTGEVLHLPSNVPHWCQALEDCVVLDVFSPPSQKTGIDRG
jgi:quercetin dioxygenase-like cupin family protein